MLIINRNMSVEVYVLKETFIIKAIEKFNYLQGSVLQGLKLRSALTPLVPPEKLTQNPFSRQSSKRVEPQSNSSGICCLRHILFEFPSLAFRFAEKFPFDFCT